jgi:nucleoid DNA-binding protein
MAARQKTATKGQKTSQTTAKKTVAKKKPVTPARTVKKTTPAKKKATPATAKKTVAKKAVAKKPVAKKVAPQKVAVKKAAVKKPAVKKTVAKTPVAKKAVVKKPAATTKKVNKLSAFPATAIAKKQTKAQIYLDIAELTGVPKAEVKQVFAALRNLVERQLKPKGSGEIVVPDLGIKLRRIQKKATKSRMGRNPSNGEEVKIPAKPARKSVKATALKTLKDIIA